MGARREAEARAGQAAVHRAREGDGGRAAAEGAERDRRTRQDAVARATATARAAGRRSEGGRRPLTGALPAPRGLTRRAAAFAVLLLVVAAALAPYLHATISQRAEVSAAEAQLAGTRGEVEELRTELERWDDPAYVQLQARVRLHMVMPGETLYRVDGVSPSQQAEDDPQAAAADVVREGADRPWFGNLWASVEAAGRDGAGR